MSKERDISILDELRHIGSGYEFSFAATFNAFFPFYEHVILRRLVSSGCRANTLVMDGRQCAAAFATGGSRPRRAGREYTLIPVRAGGAFHPKVLLLVGKRKGLMFVGSHNLTIAGFSHNRELTCRYEVNDESGATDLAAFGQAWNFLRAWTTEQPEELLKPFEDAEQYASWLRSALSLAESTEAQMPFIGARPGGQSLWEMLHPHIPANVKRVTVVAPFFDARLEFLKRLIKDLAPEEMIVGIEPETVVINAEAHRLMPPDVNVRFVDAKRLREDKGYLHAKAILFETLDGRELLITGSANASRQAWLAKAGERNAEAIIISESSSKQSPAKGLGLKALAKEPALSADVWQEIKRQAAFRPKPETSAHHIPLVAIETEQGFEIEAQFVREEIATQVELVDADENLLGVFDISFDEDGFYQINVPDIELRRRAAAITLNLISGTSLIAVVHHTFDVVVSAQTERQRELQNALSNLDAATPMLEDMLKIVERVVFDDFDNYHSVMKGAGQRAASSDEVDAQDASDEPQKTFSASLKDSQAFRRKQHRALSDDLTLIIDAVNRRLGIGLEASFGISPTIGRSDEELIEVEDEGTEVLPEVDGYALARLCQRKTATLMRRMTAQLEIAAGDEQRSIGVIRQLAAVLGILHRLREVEQVVKWIPKGDTLIREKDEWKFFLNSTRLLYSQRAPVMTRARAAMENLNERLKTLGANEPSIVAGLLLWLAWDCRLDVRRTTEWEDHDELQEILHGTARLVAMASHLCEDEAAQQKARDAIKHLCSYYNEDAIAETWCDTHLKWLSKIKVLSHNSSRKELKRTASAGDLAFPLLKSAKHPFVVLESNGSSVRVVDLDKENEQQLYGAKYVAIIDAESL